jgi:hypothetical protein
MFTEQKHLDFKNAVNLGSFYTPDKLVNLVYDLLYKNIPNFADYLILDTSCGYGSFLRGSNVIGADIDSKALEQAKQHSLVAKFVQHNSLLDVSRESYGLNDEDLVVAVGNPPYNDATSLIRNSIKQQQSEIDNDIKARDLGISFLRSYCKLQVDYVCVLHPLSYLTKKANFEQLGKFRTNYKLVDGIVVSSVEFSKTSRTTQFPIIAALYKRDEWGMQYDLIENWQFKTIDGKLFCLNGMDSIANHIAKYPNKKDVELEDTKAYFWTLRDINALKRNQTFVKDESNSTIRVTEDKFPYYCYVDVFKDYVKHSPYYFGNSDIFIDNDEFEKCRDVFVAKSLKKHSFLQNGHSMEYNQSVLDNYFRKLFGCHYVD